MCLDVFFFLFRYEDAVELCKVAPDVGAAAAPSWGLTLPSDHAPSPQSREGAGEEKPEEFRGVRKHIPRLEATQTFPEDLRFPPAPASTSGPRPPAPPAHSASDS